MATALNDATLVKNDHRRRRWMIRVCISLLLFLLLMTIAAIFLLCPSSGMTAEEAAAAHAQLKSVFTREHAELLLGKPHLEANEEGVTALHWSFITQSINSIDIFQCKLITVDDGRFRVSNHGKLRIEGWSAWMFRWLQLKGRLGIK